MLQRREDVRKSEGREKKTRGVVEDGDTDDRDFHETGIYTPWLGSCCSVI